MLQFNMQHSVGMAGTIHANMIRQMETAFERSSGNTAMQITPFRLSLRLLCGNAQSVFLNINV